MFLQSVVGQLNWDKLSVADFDGAVQFLGSRERRGGAALVRTHPPAVAGEDADSTARLLGEEDLEQQRLLLLCSLLRSAACVGSGSAESTTYK